MAQKSEPRIGLALGGGGARGLAHVLALEAFDELGVRPVAISGTSIGALVAAAYASGLAGAEIRRVVEDLSRRPADTIGRLWKLRPRRVRDGLRPAALGRAQFDAEIIVDGFLPRELPEEFSGLVIPLQIVATDFYGGCQVVLEGGNLRRAIAASLAMPMLFRPVVIDGRVMMDGGIFNPLPFDLLADRSDAIIAIDVVGGPSGPGKRLPGPLEASFGAAQLFMHAIIEEKLLRPGIQAQIFRPAVKGYGVLDFLKAREILAASAPVKEEVKRALDAMLGRDGVEAPSGPRLKPPPAVKPARSLPRGDGAEV